ncbi:competence protein [Flavobacteriales bacterium 34_180_T64]|nr:competence protein [Flavobacteriales bacterium 34_180_T64]
MKIFDFSIIKLTICLVIGIITAHISNITLSCIFIIASFLILLVFLLFLFARNQFNKTIWYGLAVFTTMSVIGILIYNLHDQKNFKGHYLKNENIRIEQTNFMTIKVKELLKPNSYNTKYIVEIIKINSEYLTGKLLLNVKHDSLQNPYEIDDILLTKVKFTNINPPLNPNQFDYQHYLEKKYIYHQIHTNNQSIYTISSSKNSIFGWAGALRDHINKKLLSHNLKPDVLAIINALILGQRQGLSKEIYSDYVNAGAIHILAVSGLHVGLILLILNKLFSPISYLKHGRILKVFIILILLWGFAVIAGLSASVTRAVTMFSIVAIAMHLKRPTNIYNTLAVSMFILLLFKPLFLFDIGFQLSYLAVISIVTIHPLLYKLWRPKWKTTTHLWQIFTVSIAAQFGVVPISLYYFHQFPGLFLISNMILLPFLGLILGLGILIIVLAVFNALPAQIAHTYESIISTMNLIISWISKQETFLFKDISFNIYHVFATYIILIIILKFFYKRNYQNMKLLLMSVMILQVALIIQKFETNNREFLIFNKSRYSILGHKINSTLHVSHTMDSSKLNTETIIKNYRIQNFIKTLELEELESVYTFNDKTLLIIDSLGIYNVMYFRPNYILLKDSPKLNLTRLIDSIKPQLIIADGSNYKSYVQRWKSTCETKKIPFHYTYEKGAYIYQY